MPKIHTAKLLLANKETFDLEYSTVSKNDALESMIEFAKLHVEAALKNCLDKYHHSIKEGYDFGSSEIMNSYPLTNIK